VQLSITIGTTFTSFQMVRQGSSYYLLHL